MFPKLDVNFLTVGGELSRLAIKHDLEKFKLQVMVYTNSFCLIWGKWEENHSTQETTFTKFRSGAT